MGNNYIMLPLVYCETFQRLFTFEIGKTNSMDNSIGSNHVIPSMEIDVAIDQRISLRENP